MADIRIGQGFDVHRLVEDRPLIIGGIQIDFEKGLAGHSDADVLLHAICDALLGGLALGDIGYHFPDTDDQYKNANSRELLDKVAQLIEENHYKILNIDCTIIAQSPKMAPYVDSMRKLIAQILDLRISQVSVKATTTELLGFTGRGEGIAAQAIALLQRKRVYDNRPK